VSPFPLNWLLGRTLLHFNSEIVKFMLLYNISFSIYLLVFILCVFKSLTWKCYSLVYVPMSSFPVHLVLSFQNLNLEFLCVLNHLRVLY
jgi:hypothetical protein